MKERTRSILEASVRDFIETGNPVTSERLYKKYKFGIKPAMIRWELHDLAKKNFLSQKHPSGGRIPSDRAYRFFVEEVWNEIEKEEETREAENLIELLLEGERRKFVKTLAEELRLLGICYDAKEEVMHNSGFKDLIESIGERANILNVLRDFEMIPERLCEQKSWWEKESSWPQVFVGKNPITSSSHLSVIAGKMNRGGRGDILILAVGPKRMNYEQSLRTFKNLLRLIE
ncbi:hypothetical protein CL629_03485 [bacterium]|nr:hypothetical protein [bacterium]|tara:strand:- start:1256 stop:1948 length:693 start_codon:yes stop_codon:yes gene_type:complete